MFSGKVSAWYARAHHEKWYNEKLREEMEWEDRVEAEVLQEAGAHAHQAYPVDAQAQDSRTPEPAAAD
jgi:hypothetical protein